MTKDKKDYLERFTVHMLNVRAKKVEDKITILTKQRNLMSDNLHRIREVILKKELTKTKKRLAKEKEKEMAIKELLERNCLQCGKCMNSTNPTKMFCDIKCVVESRKVIYQ